MVNYIGNILDEIPEYMKGESATPYPHHLFIFTKIRPNCPEPTQNSFIFFGASIVSFKVRYPRHAVGIFIIMY